MKKSLILLPLAGLFLTSCGGPNGELPSGGKEVDPKNETQVSDFATKAADTVIKSGMALKTGVKAALKVKIDNVDVSGDDGEVAGSLKANNIEFTVNLAAYGLEKEDVYAWQASAEIAFNSGKINAEFTKPSIKTDIDLAGLKLGAYLSNGNVYADLSNEKIESVANIVIAAAFADKGSTTIEFYKAIVKAFLGKVTVSDVLKGSDAKPIFPKEEPTAKELADIVSGAKQFVLNTTSNEQLAKLIKFVTYDDGRIGIGLTAVDGDIIKDSTGATTSTGKVAASVVTTKEHKLDSITGAVDLSISNKVNGKETARAKLVGNVELKFTFGTGAVKFPGDLNSYKEISLPSTSLSSFPAPQIIL